jgi:endonuclease YncB( thermonuclease family)
MASAPTQPPPAVPKPGTLAHLWSVFRGTPVWAQVVLWILAWPFLAALVLVSSPRLSARRVIGAGLILLIANPVTAWLIGGNLGYAPWGVAADELSPGNAVSRHEPKEESAGGPIVSRPALRAMWTVVNVVDGDTVDVRSAAGTQLRVRIIGIDAPETGECGFGQATDALADLILNRTVQLVPGARDDRDRYDRILRYIDVDHTDAGLYLIEQGLAIARYDARDGYGRHRRQDEYVAADRSTEHICGVTFESVAPPPRGLFGPSPGGSQSQVPGESSSNGIVKKSNNDICHAPGTTYYDRTIYFTPYDTVEACLESGGRLPRG